MPKHEMRVKMKALYIAKFIAENHIMLMKMPSIISPVQAVHIRAKAQAMAQTPAKLFRHDKPELDKRRWKRYNRKQMKGAYLVTTNTQ